MGSAFAIALKMALEKSGVKLPTKDAGVLPETRALAPAKSATAKAKSQTKLERQQAKNYRQSTAEERLAQTLKFRKQLPITRAEKDRLELQKMQREYSIAFGSSGKGASKVAGSAAVEMAASQPTSVDIGPEPHLYEFMQFGLGAC